MGRLIDADELKIKLYHYLKDCMFNDGMINPLISYTDILQLLDEQHTAYDVDKVVEELENLIVYEILGGLIAGEWIKKEQVLKILKEGGMNDR